MAKWTINDMPDQTGRTILVTGATSGLGLHSAVALAARGAKLLITCRNPERGRAALTKVAEHAAERPELIELDLADLASVRKAAAEVREKTGDALNVLMNNAGVMATPQRKTQDGFELQIGTNHLGHAALTWLLMPALRGPDTRVVTLASIAHRRGGLDVEDLNFQRRPYNAATAYSQSKLANLLFSMELDRAARRAGLGLISVAAHPGITHTELASKMIEQRSMPGVVSSVVNIGSRLMFQPAERGILPQLYAATAPGVSGGDYYGPDGPAEMRGYPTRATPTRTARNEQLAQRLWQVTAELTGVEPDPA